MKTPLKVLLTALAYWIAIYAVTQVPMYSKNYHVNLIWMTVVIPNVMRFMVGGLPQLAVDRNFFLTSTVISLILTYVLTRVWKATDEALKDSKSDNNKKLQLSALLALTFVAGALITYYTGIDNSIYSNMGWEQRTA
jgi:FtsH-binding integral membrane protein